MRIINKFIYEIPKGSQIYHIEYNNKIYQRKVNNNGIYWWQYISHRILDDGVSEKLENIFQNLIRKDKLKNILDENY
jgi:hypothetical protein